ncbi:hypothetical protein OIV83_004643 [Microbotryomycetes sp. JL201]|nr:hypothetical protein OIV83_004643 [Microbotryomycetes sp. JL201]
MPFHLSQEQKLQFDRDGYLVIKSFLSPDTVERLLERSHQLLRDFTLEGHPMTTFSTEDDDSGKGKGKGTAPSDTYFLESGDKVRYFFEVDSFTNGQLNRPKELAVNKIGHSLHTEDDAFRRATLENPDIQNLIRELGMHKDPRVVQSMVICKQPGIGGAVTVHDDSTFLYTSPLSAAGLWFPLEDATATNGCLSFVPGSHKTNQITHRLERIDGGRQGTAIREIEGMADAKITDWAGPHINWVSEPVKAGDLVLIHGSVIHRSERNASPRSRFVYTFHIIDGACDWPETNWLQPVEGKPFTKLLHD